MLGIKIITGHIGIVDPRGVREDRAEALGLAQHDFVGEQLLVNRIVETMPDVDVMRGKAFAHIQADIAPTRCRRPPLVDRHIVERARFFQVFRGNIAGVTLAALHLLVGNILIRHNFDGIAVKVGATMIPVGLIGFENGVLITFPFNQFVGAGDHGRRIDFGILFRIAPI